MSNLCPIDVAPSLMPDGKADLLYRTGTVKSASPISKETGAQIAMRITIAYLIVGVACGCLIAGSAYVVYSYHENTGSGYWYRAVAASPNDSKDFTFLGYSLEAEGRYTDAENAFQRARSLQATNFSAAMELGSLAERRGDLAGARLYWEQIADATNEATTNRGRTWHARSSANLAQTTHSGTDLARRDPLGRSVE